MLEYIMPKETLKLKLIDLIRHVYIFIKYIQNRFVHHRDFQATQKYWESPDDGDNKPSQYVSPNQLGIKRTKDLISMISKLGIDNPKILEVGCNAGRNLNALYEQGYRNLHGLEISPNAVRALRENFPNLENITIDIGTAEDLLKSYQDNSFDIVFTMAVLQHIHPESIDDIVNNITRISKSYCISHEVETHSSWRHYPRSYKVFYKKFGLKHLGRFDHMRVFQK